MTGLERRLLQRGEARHTPGSGSGRTSFLQAHCHRAVGMLYCQTGQSEQARAELSAALEMYRDREMMFWLPETKAALPEVEGVA